MESANTVVDDIKLKRKCLEVYGRARVPVSEAFDNSEVLSHIALVFKLFSVYYNIKLKELG